jgi:hypothetical protein
MSSVLDRVLTLPIDERRRLLAALTPAERALLSQSLGHRAGVTAYTRYADDPVGFTTDVLHETVWSKQRQIMESVRDNKRTAVPACHAPGKSHTAARVVAWWGSVHPPGTARIVTTASTFRQVKNVLWPHLRRVIQRHGLPGETNLVEWRIGQETVADGFSPADHDEAAVQGIHAPHLLVVVDEAGGIGPTLGRALEALMTGGHTRLLLLGNPPTDQEGSWFETACSSPLYTTIPIPASATPNFTGEDAGICKACPPEVPEHPVAEHLVDHEWVEDVISEFGDDSAFVEARVHARFPRQTANKVIPLSWVEAAVDNEQPDVNEVIKLGVDVASDGGDEFVVAWYDRGAVSVRHRSSGQENANAVDVAGVVLRQIQEAEQAHRDRGVEAPVRVKIDSIGVGWAVCSVLSKWRDEQMHGADIIGVNVSEKAGEPVKFANQRAEMWWTGRAMLQPAKDGSQRLRVDVDRRGVAQLAGPKYRSDSSGRIVIEAKKDMKRRGLQSPDRADAMLLAVYEPPGPAPLPVVMPVSMPQSNPWAGL